MAVSAAAHCALCIPEVLHPEGDDREPAIIFLDMDGVMKWGATKDELIEKHFPDKTSFGEGYREFIQRRSLFAGREIDPWEKLHPDSDRLKWGASYLDYCQTVVDGRQLNKESLESLQQLIKRVEAIGKRALIVISSAWRNNVTTRELCEEVFDETHFGKHICGKAAPGHGDGFAPECKYRGIDFAKHAEENHGISFYARADVIEYWLKDHGLEEASFVILDDKSLELLSSADNRFGERFVEIHRRFDQAKVDEAFAQLCLKNKDPELSGKGE